MSKSVMTNDGELILDSDKLLDSEEFEGVTGL